MERYFIELSYNGSNYCGWQRQINANSVEQTIEESLSKIIGCVIDVVGCGRTDTGVNARFCVAHFDVNTSIEFDQKFVYHLNAILPKDIYVYKIYKCDKHARFDAKVRQYKYYVSRSKPIFDNLVWYIWCDLDYKKMNEAARFLQQYDDFTSFAKVGSDNKTNICKISEAYWEVLDNGREVFTISADRFLRGMVRGIVGTLVEVGKGKLSVDQFVEIIEAKDRNKAKAQAPAQGLFLTDVKY